MLPALARPHKGYPEASGAGRLSIEASRHRPARAGHRPRRRAHLTPFAVSSDERSLPLTFTRCRF
jgi:hypothetical protein